MKEDNEEIQVKTRYTNIHVLVWWCNLLFCALTANWVSHIRLPWGSAHALRCHRWAQSETGHWHCSFTQTVHYCPLLWNHRTTHFLPTKLLPNPATVWECQLAHNTYTLPVNPPAPYTLVNVIIKCTNDLWLAARQHLSCKVARCGRECPNNPTEEEYTIPQPLVVPHDWLLDMTHDCSYECTWSSTGQIDEASHAYDRWPMLLMTWVSPAELSSCWVSAPSLPRTSLVHFLAIDRWWMQSL